MNWRRLVVGLAVGLASCKHGDAKPSAPPADPYREQEYAAGPSPSSARVFLVAGGDDIANFAAEVLEQRTLWRRAGLSEEDIVCYFAKPTAQAWRRDTKQFSRLADALRSCRRASMDQLAADLRAAANEHPSFVYLYVTSHGLRSQLQPLQRSKRARTQRFVASLSAEERAVLDPAAIGLEAGPSPGLGDPRATITRLRKGVPETDLQLTPRTLGRLLAAFDPQTPKVVVLQACYSGGFIDHHATTTHDDSPGTADLLALDNLTILTATAAERPSFGCGSGSHRTYFGGAFNKALEHELKRSKATSTTQIDWKAVYERVEFAVEAMEHVDGQRASMPGFVQTP